MITKAQSNQEPRSVHAIEVTPDILREWANRLETKVAMPGQLVRLPIASEYELFYDPCVSPAKVMNLIEVKGVSDATSISVQP